MLVLNKTSYLDYRICARYGWRKLHKQISDSEIRQELYRQGYQVENLAKQLFSGGYDVGGERQRALKNTQVRIENSRNGTLYQATALSPDNLLAKADIVAVNEDHSLNLYEVKMANDVGLDPSNTKNKDRKEKHLSDIAFQQITFERSNYTIRRTFLIHPDKEYRLQGETIDPRYFFKVIDVSKQVMEVCKNVATEIEEARRCYENAQEPICECYSKPKAKRCITFRKFHPQIPDKNSIFDIHNIRVKKILPLYQNNILRIKDIDTITQRQANFSAKQLNHIQVIQTQRPIIDKVQISKRLAKLKKPLYFLDYESINYPIPVLRNAGPFQQIPFQFSLFILEDKHEQPSHKEYLMQEASRQELDKLIKHLQTYIASRGSIIVWHQSAEKYFQKNLAALSPETSAFFDDLNHRLFDLEKIFTKQHYVHPDFEGRTSLKSVLPALIPEFGWSDLKIQEGSLAGKHWDEALAETDATKQKIFTALLKYCRRDTEALVAIYKFLNALVVSQ